ncbi:hypothetical protein Q427_08615 [Halomonas sp. BC04]|nr:hypothetical protein Q427_08615 [Halomonas sp. BC04]
MIQVPAALQANRILADVSALLRIVVAVAVVVEARFFVVPLALEADRL